MTNLTTTMTGQIMASSNSNEVTLNSSHYSAYANIAFTSGFGTIVCPQYRDINILRLQAAAAPTTSALRPGTEVPGAYCRVLQKITNIIWGHSYRRVAAKERPMAHDSKLPLYLLLPDAPPEAALKILVSESHILKILVLYIP